MYDLKILLKLKPHAEIARGSGPLPELDLAHARWIAVRGSAPDWAIYYGDESTPIEDIRDHGTKLQHTRAIRRIVPCTNGMYRRYRW